MRKLRFVATFCLTLALMLPSQARLVDTAKCRHKVAHRAPKEFALYHNAALAYLYQNVPQQSQHMPYYRALSGQSMNRIYYRDCKTHKVVWFTPYWV